MKRTVLGRLLLVLVMCLVLILPAGCAAKPTPTPTIKPPPTPPPPLILPSESPLAAPKPTEPPKMTGTPDFEFQDPREGYKNPGDGFQVIVIAKNFSLMKLSGPTVNWANAGKAVVYLDVEPPTKKGESAIAGLKKDTQYGECDGIGQYVFKKTAAGPHTIYCQLVNYDYTPLDPPVVKKVNITCDYTIVKPPALTGAVGCQILAPAQGAVITSPTFPIKVKLTNFSSVEVMGPITNYTYAGQVVCYLDKEPPTTKGKTALSGTYRIIDPVATHTDTVTMDWISRTAEAMPAGKHTIYVQLINYDNTPLDPPCTSKVEFETKY